MQFKVPQFLDIEDKIFGPFSVRQVVYIAGAGGIIYVLYKQMPIYMAAPFMIGIGALAFMLSFTPLDKYGRPFIDILQSAVNFSFRSKLFVWKYEKEKKERESEQKDSQSVTVDVANVGESQLQDMSWSIEVKNDSN